MAGEPPEPLPGYARSCKAIQSALERTAKARSHMRRAEDASGGAAASGAGLPHGADGKRPFARPSAVRATRLRSTRNTTVRFQRLSTAPTMRRVTLFDTHLPFTDVTAIYAPFGVDNHVDHQLVRDWALVLTGSNGRAARSSFTKNIRYARSRPALQRAQTFYRQQLPALTLDERNCPAQRRRSRRQTARDGLLSLPSASSLERSGGNGTPHARLHDDCG